MKSKFGSLRPITLIKCLPGLIRKEGAKTQITNIRNESDGTTIEPINIVCLIQECYENFMPIHLTT